MRTSVKVLLNILAVVLLSCALTAAVLLGRDWMERRTYYPMGGDVLVLYKFKAGGLSRHVTDDKYYLVIQTSNSDGTNKTNYLLSCTKEQYDSVEIGDTANCERDQKTDDFTGIIHKIEKRGD